MNIKLHTKKELVMNHERFEQDFMSTALSLLDSYKGDVEYWTQMGNEAGGVDYFNHYTSGSPCWEEGEENQMNDYNNFVQDFVAVFKTELEERRS
mgnify:FL=1|tara:strand:+ start:192 stop:476 length:285 start_codon:yes stop_codon:yes gene_type:complete